MSTNTENHSESMNKEKNIFKQLFVPMLIIAAFVVGILISTQMSNTDEEKVIATTKSFVANHFVSLYYEEFQDLGLEFSDIKAEETKKETKNKPGFYKVTGEVEYDETTYSFTSEIEIRDGMTFPNNKVTVDELQ